LGWEQGQGVEVGLALQEAPVEAGGGGAVGGGCGEVAYGLGRVDGGAGGEGWDHWLVRRAVGALGDYYDAAAGYWAGVRDGAGGGGEDRLAGGAGQVDASVAGEPGLGGWGVGVDDPGARVERPDRGRGWWDEREQQGGQ
jgi:hypothetical protein